MEIRKIDYDFTPDDDVAFARYAADHDQNGRDIPRTRPWAWVCLVVFVVAGVASAWLEKGTLIHVDPAPREPMSLFEWAKALIILIVIVVSILLYFFRNPIRAYWVRRRYRNPEKARWLGRYTLSISPDTFTITTPLSSSTLKWEVVDRIAIAKDYAFLLLNPRTAHVLPRRAFLDENDFLDFVETMKRYHAVALRDNKGPKEPFVVPARPLSPGQPEADVRTRKPYGRK